MNCCHGENKNRNDRSKPNSIITHFIMIILCCVLPVLLLLLVPLLNTKIPALGSLMAAAAPFVCPVMMLLMAGLMFMKKKNPSDKV